MRNELNLFDEQIGKKVKQFRLNRGFTQEELGRKIGISHQQIQKYERGVNCILAFRLYDLVKELSIDVADFFTDVPIESKSSCNNDEIFSCDEDDHEILNLVRKYRKIKSKESRKAVYSLVKALSQ